ncbi:MAG: ribosome maturation factor [Saprospiraceae bacterium]|nr:ribosome maturation factor [Candidatus Vicinibacter affinis]
MAKNMYICTGFTEREQKVPFFVACKQEMYTEEVHNLLLEKFKEENFQDCFLVALEQKGKNVGVFLDSDSGIQLEICRQISRFLEEHFDQNKWFGVDYVLEVSSAGLSRPLKFPRQYVKNIGRELKMVQIDGSQLQGKLIQADLEKITLEWEEIRKENKKKIKEIKQILVPYQQIKEAKIIVKI